MNKCLGRFWNDKDLSIFEIEGRKIVISDNWNGEVYDSCFELSDNLTDIISSDLTVKPVTKYEFYKIDIDLDKLDDEDYDFFVGFHHYEIV